MNSDLQNVSLRGKELLFTFPDIARTVRSLAKKHIESVVEEASPMRREELLRDFWENWRMGDYNPALNDYLYQCIRRMSVAEREDALGHFLKPGQTLDSLKQTIPVPQLMEALGKAALEKDPSLEDDSVVLSVQFQRTFRIPDDDRKYPLPAGHGLFPLSSVDDHPRAAPQSWMKRGGIALPPWYPTQIWPSASSFSMNLQKRKLMPRRHYWERAVRWEASIRTRSLTSHNGD